MPKKILYKIDFGYSPQATDEQMEAIQKFFPKIAFKTKKDFEYSSHTKEQSAYAHWDEEDFLQDLEDRWDEYINMSPRSFDVGYNNADNYIDLESFLEQCDIEIKITGRQTITFTNTETQIDLTEYQNIFKTLERLSHQLQDRDSFNSHCQVHVVGSHLMTVNELMFCEDYCTDALQDRLNEGWKIISCCVQDAWRPDYVLGRYNPNYIPTSGAERG